MPYRFFICFLAFCGDMCVSLLARNMVFALNVMVVSSTMSDTNSTVEGKCFEVANSPLEKFEDNVQRFDFSQSYQANLLTVVYIGLLLGNIGGLFIYDYIFMRPVAAVCLMVSGLLNISTSLILRYVGKTGLLMGRFFIGMYLGLILHVATCKNVRQLVKQERFDIVFAFRFV